MSGPLSPKNLRLPQYLKATIESNKMNLSLNVRFAVAKAAENPQVLVRALENRLTLDEEGNYSSKTSYRPSEVTLSQIEQLAKLAKLSEEEVVRLALEAYIYNLN